MQLIEVNIVWFIHFVTQCKSCATFVNKFSAHFLILDKVKHLADKKSRKFSEPNPHNVTQLYEMLDVLSL